MSDASGGSQPRFVRPVTPAELTDTIRALIEQLAPGQTPVYADVVPMEGESVNECFGLVNRCVAEKGGEALVGWSLWELPTLFVEAEFHAIWRSPSGSLLDISPRSSPTARVLFLPDPVRRYEGRSIDNVRVPIRRDPTLLEYLDTFAAKFEIMKRGARVDQHGEVHLIGAEAAEFQAIMTRQAFLRVQLQSQHPVVGPYHPCPCGSGKEVKWCCGTPR